MRSLKNETTINNNNKIFTGYLLFNYPDQENFFQAAKSAVKKGMDILEIGFPSSDPYKDGPVIQEAQKMIDMSKIYDITSWIELRQEVSCPIWLMGYKKDLFYSQFYKTLCKENLIDGIIIPDLSYEENVMLQSDAELCHVDVIPFILNKEKNLNRYCQNFSILYYQLMSGATGQTLDESIAFNEQKLVFEQYSNTYVFGGFGIKTVDQASHIWRQGFKGIIIGTELINKLNISQNKLNDYINCISEEKNKVIDWKKIEFPSKQKLHKNITVGQHTYYAGSYNLGSFQEQCVRYMNDDKLIIGKFCSIASGVIFNMGGSESHIPSWATTYPLGKIYPDLCPKDGYTRKGDTVIGNDVWLGTECIIMPGVKIGDGAIVGARAIVTKDVPEYSVVVGAPAKIVKKRFSDQIINSLKEIKWWDMDFESLAQLFPYMTSKNVNLFIKMAKEVQYEIDSDTSWRNIV